MAETIPYIQVQGTHYEVGRQLGEHSKAVLPRFMRAASVLEDRQAILSQSGVLSQSLRAAADRYPKLMDELRGIADGAGVRFQDLFIFNWRPRPRTAAKTAEGCTTLIVPRPEGVLLAHNEDWHTGTNDCFLARLEYEGGVKVLAVCYHGFLPGLSISINEFGLVQALNNVIASDGAAGIPLALVDRAALDARSIDEAIQVVTQAGRADSENFNFAQDTRAVYVETSAREFEVVEVTAPTAHTNHFLTERLRRLEASTRLTSSVEREKRARALLGGLQAPRRDDLVAILKSHEGAPWTICRHGRDGPPDYSDTLATGLADTAAGTLEVGFGNPCRATFRTFTL